MTFIHSKITSNSIVEVSCSKEDEVLGHQSSTPISNFGSRMSNLSWKNFSISMNTTSLHRQVSYLLLFMMLFNSFFSNMSYTFAQEEAPVVADTSAQIPQEQPVENSFAGIPVVDDANADANANENADAATEEQAPQEATTETGEATDVPSPLIKGDTEGFVDTGSQVDTGSDIPVATGDANPATGEQAPPVVTDVSTDANTGSVTTSTGEVFTDTGSTTTGEATTERSFELLEKKQIVKADIKVELAPGTVISTNFEEFDMSAAPSVTIDASDIQAQEITQEQKMLDIVAPDTLPDTIENPDTVLEFGIDGVPLKFSKAAKVTIETELEDGTEVQLLVQHEGSEEWNSKGLSVNPEATCNTDGRSSDESAVVTVANGTVIFYTCGASTFILNPTGDGSNEARLWLKPEGGLVAITNGVKWTDSTPNNYLVDQTADAQEPTSMPADASHNFHSYIDFDGSDMLDNDDPMMAAASSGSVFFVITYRDLAGYDSPVDFDWDDPHIGRYTDNPVLWKNGSSAVQFIPANLVLTTDKNYLQSFRWNGGTNGGLDIGLNGTVATDTTMDFNTIAQDNLGIGAANPLAEALDGTMSEVLIYNQKLTPAQTNIIESYLATKYGLTLSGGMIDYTNSASTIVWDDTTNASYKYDIAGLGRDDATTLNQKVSNSINGGSQPVIYAGSYANNLPTSNSGNTNTIDNMEYMYWSANMSGNASFSTNYAPNSYSPDGTYVRTNKVWRVSETNDVGTVTVKSPSKVAKHLLVSTDGTFNPATTTEYLLTDDGAGNKIASVNLADGEYFAFGQELYAPGCYANGLRYRARADQNVTLSGTKVSHWQDINGGVTVTNSSTYRPSYNANYLNFNPGVFFNNAHALGINGSDQIIQNDTSPVTLFAMTTDQLNNGGWQNIISLGGPYDLPSLHWRENIPNAYIDFAGGSYDHAGGSYPLNTPAMFGVRARNDNAAGAVNIVLNGINNQTNRGGTFLFDGTFPAGKYLTNNDFVLGAETMTAGESMLGHMGEAIVYESYVPDAELAKIITAEGIQYGITLSQDYVAGNGTIIWTQSGGYNNNVAGIGREDCQIMDQKQSWSTLAGTAINPIIGLGDITSSNANNPNTFSVDQSFMVWGHNNASTSPTTAGLPSGIPSLANSWLARNWKVDMTNFNQITDLKLDGTGVNALGFNKNSPTYVIVSDSPTFTNPTSYLMAGGTSGSKTAHNINFKSADSNGDDIVYYTFIGEVLSNSCTATEVFHPYSQLRGNRWNYGARTKNHTVGTQKFNFVVSDPFNHLRQWAPFTRGDNIGFWYKNNKQNEDTVFTMNLSGAALVSFSVNGLYSLSYPGWYDFWQGRVTVVGYQGATPVATGNISIVTNNPNGIAISGNTAYAKTIHNYGHVNVSFDKKVDKVEIRIGAGPDMDNAPWEYWNFMYIGPVTAYCPPLVSELTKVVNPGTVDAGYTGEIQYELTYWNDGSSTTNQTGLFTDVLPAGLLWSGGTVINPFSGTTVNAYATTNTLTISNIQNQGGLYKIYATAYPSAPLTSGTKLNQASVTYGTSTLLSDDPTLSGSNNPTPLTIVPALPNMPVTIAKSVTGTSTNASGATIKTNQEATYTFTFTNSSASAVSVNLLDSFVNVTLVTGSMVNPLGGTINSGAGYAGKSSLDISNLSVPVGTSTITVRAVGVSTGEYNNIADYFSMNTGYKQEFKKTNGAYLTVLENIIGCGDGIIQTGEVCDDSNTTAGDGCSATCTLESGATCAIDIAPVIGVCDTAGTSSVINQDNDNDGVLDNIDIDDDNDGVLDAVENEELYLIGNGGLIIKFNSPSDLANLVSGVTLNPSGNANLNNDIGVFGYGGKVYLIGDGGYVVEFNNPTDLANLTGGVTLNPSGNANLNNDIGVFGYGGKVYLIGDGGYVVEFNNPTDLANLTGGVTLNPAGNTILSNDIGAFEYRGKVYLIGDGGYVVEFNNPTDLATLTNGVTLNPGGNIELNNDIDAFVFDSAKDTDNDGIPNVFDLDSDNDGCSDAFEAGATTNTTTNYQFTGIVGINGLLNTLESNDSYFSAETLYTGTYDDNANNSGISLCGTLCGNGSINSGETCDDGNLLTGDGCSATCTLETGATCAIDIAPVIGVCDTAGTGTVNPGTVPTVTGPTSGTNITGTTIPVIGTGTPGQIISIVNASGVVLTTGVVDGSGNFSIPTPLTTGSNALTAVGPNGTGNSTTVTYTPVSIPIVPAPGGVAYCANTNGVKWEMYQTYDSNLSDGIAGSLQQWGYTHRFNNADDIVLNEDSDTFSLKLTSNLLITATGNYSFRISTDDAGALFVDGTQVVTTLNTTATSSSINLSAGYHTLELRYSENGGVEDVNLEYQGPDQTTMGQIPGSKLFLSNIPVSAWFKANAITGVSHGATPATWIDNSPQANNASQIGTTAVPYQSQGAGMINYNQTLDVQRAGGYAITDTNMPDGLPWEGQYRSIFVVAKPDVTNLDQYLLAYGRDNAASQINALRVLNNDSSFVSRSQDLNPDNNIFEQ